MDFLRKELQETNIQERINNLYAYWDKNFEDVDALIVNNGSDEADNLKIKVIAVHAWLFRTE